MSHSGRARLIDFCVTPAVSLAMGIERPAERAESPVSQELNFLSFVGAIPAHRVRYSTAQDLKERVCKTGLGLVLLSLWGAAE